MEIIMKIAICLLPGTHCWTTNTHDYRLSPSQYFPCFKCYGLNLKISLHMRLVFGTQYFPCFKCYSLNLKISLHMRLVFGTQYFPCFKCYGLNLKISLHMRLVFGTVESSFIYQSISTFNDPRKEAF